ncbi:MAG: hypothetical protein A3B70_04400 [Deltaproteobacteria bacterium RIFCSPHIGHO2_02_FULL_40_11]|nr:MAG: hypothetical protein A3B70_04400 [Deltaproteobacteria bacterium RIFCSPHIGHO2_02_FULL_40_11]
MYKLKHVQGKYKDISLNFEKGPVLVGREKDCHMILSNSNVSKHHARFQLKNKTVILEDLKSRNGTFVNGVLIQTKEITSGDKIAFGDDIFEFQRVQAQPEIPKQTQVLKKEKEKKDFFQVFNPVWDVIVERIEWKYFTLTLVFVFMAANFIFTVPPLLQYNQDKLENEASKRAEFIIKQIATENRKFLSLKDGHLVSDTLNLSTALAKHEDRILSVNIIDPRTKKIIAPAQRYDQPIANRGDVLRGAETKILLTQKISENRMLISYPIRLYTAPENDEVAAIIQAVFNLEGIGLSKNAYQTMLLKAFLMSFLFALAFYILLQKVTSHAFRRIYKEMETAQEKGYRHLELRTRFDEMNRVIHTINQVYRTTRDLLSKNPDPEAQALPTHNTDEILKNLLSALPEGVVILDDAYSVLKMNEPFQKLTGLKHQDVMDKNILDLIENQELLRNISHGLGQASLGADSIEDLDIEDTRYQIHVTANRTPDNLIDFYIINVKRAA